MFATLADFDPITAAAVLARAAVSIAEEDNPAAEEHLPDERVLRQALLSEVRRTIGVRSDDCSPETLERVADVLDAEADRLIGPTDEGRALERLAISGDLPSDLYQVNVIPNIAEFHGKHFQKEEARIRQTVKSPDQEMHYGPSADATQPALISLFSKSFDDRFSYRSFILLVAGQRRGIYLDVHQAWRIYRDVVNIDGAKTLVDVLRRFSEKYGVELEVGGKRGKFVIIADIDNNRPISTQIKMDTLAPRRQGKNERRTATFSVFVQKKPMGGAEQAVFAIAADLDMYRDTLQQRGW
ncbi:hypothetical protein [Burkholderia ubonensis]|uniref:hypothetical protein n=1 Tax=Burkholderia ubonensis TaxID=101571 RepID=UPI000A5E551B|nr:hypothetical protein [Burkholderia ubonensis]